MEIKNNEQHEAVLKVIEILMDADPDPVSDAGTTLDYLAKKAQEYETKHYST